MWNYANGIWRPNSPRETPRRKIDYSHRGGNFLTISFARITPAPNRTCCTDLLAGALKGIMGCGIKPEEQTVAKQRPDYLCAKCGHAGYESRGTFCSGGVVSAGVEAHMEGSVSLSSWFRLIFVPYSASSTSPACRFMRLMSATKGFKRSSGSAIHNECYPRGAGVRVVIILYVVAKPVYRRYRAHSSIPISRVSTSECSQVSALPGSVQS